MVTFNPYINVIFLCISLFVFNYLVIIHTCISTVQLAKSAKSCKHFKMIKQTVEDNGRMVEVGSKFI